ncbi:MAG: DUF3180 domain-containing protein [Microbacterium sp.]
MKRTSGGILVLFAVIGAAAGYVLDQVLTATGRATFTPSLAMAALLVIIGLFSLALAWPVRRSVRTGIRIDPFRATRALTLARASSLLGALMLGFGGGLFWFLLSRPIDPPVGSTVAMVALIGGAVVLIVAALVAEQFCTLPKDPDDREPAEPTPDPGAGEFSTGH